MSTVQKKQTNLREKLAELLDFRKMRDRLSGLGLYIGKDRTNTDENLLVRGGANVDDLQIGEIAALVGGTAVDVFVYDTGRDSDGGKWRERTQHTSWYNEELNTATRGARREFPAVAVIVAEANKVTIYDGDDPDMGMWMVFTVSNTTWFKLRLSVNNCSCISALNGILCAGGNGNGIRLAVVDFVKDNQYLTEAGFTYYNTFISTRNNATTHIDDGGSKSIVNSYINDIAMTVLPNAPIDENTGLPVPTIAVATDGGVSVIKDDGTVVDIICNNSSFKYSYYVIFDQLNRLFFSLDGQGNSRRMWGLNDIPATDLVVTTNINEKQDADIFIADDNGYGTATKDMFLFNQSSSQTTGLTPDSSIGTNKGLFKAFINREDSSKSLHNYTTSKYNTGWMPGDIKLATLSDTTVENIGVNSDELVTNGKFDTDTSGWTEARPDTILSVVSGQLKVERSTAADYGVEQATISVVSGKTYVLSFDYDVSSITNTTHRAIYVNETTTLPISDYLVKSTDPDVGSTSVTFTATSTGTKELSLRSIAGNNQASGDYFLIDNVSIRLAEEDRSVNGNGLQVFGTVTKNPVATGADLVAYSGFSANNYLVQPYNEDLDFGTGDFCIMGWVKVSDMASSTYSLVYRSSEAITGNYYHCSLNVGKLKFARHDGAGEDSLSGSTDLDNNTWHHFCGVYEGDDLKIYIDGRADANKVTAVNTDLVDDSSAVLTLGIRPNSTQFLNEGSLALCRVSATAPTDAQIAKIYRDEKVLFQDGAQATLHGTSDSVTALAYDDKTELLHVGTSSGRSDFSGLRRINNTTTAITTSISAHNNLIAEQ